MIPVAAAFDSLHRTVVHGRRVAVLAALIAPLLRDEHQVLDVGCGDGQLDRLLLQHIPDLELQGVDVLVRENTAIPVTGFDGERLPLDDGSVDAVLLVDVLHHCDSPAAMLAEGARVARRAVVIKDHRCDGWLAGPVLRLMDRVGNARHGVALPYNYWSHDEWQHEIAAQGLAIEHWSQDVPIYPPPASWIFGRGLHFVARLSCGGA